MTDKNESPSQRNKGGQPGNRSALRHGLRAGQLPKDARYIEHRLNELRRTLEDAVIDVHSEVSLTAAATIQTILRYEKHSCLCQRWLTKAGDTLKPIERMQFSREIARASAERDKCLACLELRKKKTLTLTSYVLNGDNK